MKKLSLMLFGAVFFCGLSYSHSVMKDASHVWRSSETNGTGVDGDVILATGPVQIWDVTVTSAGVGFSAFRYYNTTGTVTGGVSRSSSTVYNVGTLANRFDINEILSRGLRYEATGYIRIRWDWVFTAPKGQETRGLKN